MTGNAPHLSDRDAVTLRRGNFFIPGDLVRHGDSLVQSGSMHVEWEAPARNPRETPIVLVHGGGGQGTDWKETPDGRPGWSELLVRGGYPVYTVDRPGHGRSSRVVPGADDLLPPFSYETARWLWAPEEFADEHSQWAWETEPGTPFMDQLTASAGSTRADAASSQALDGRRLADLLDRIGPAVLMTHSAGAPSGWLAANLRPDSVRAIVAVEPLGPPWAERRGTGAMRWGITHAPMRYEPPVYDPSELRDGSVRSVPGLRGTPILVVSGEASHVGIHAPAMGEFLRGVGASSELMHLPDLGIRGNGHGPMFEANSAEVLRPILEWIERVV